MVQRSQNSYSQRKKKKKSKLPQQNWRIQPKPRRPSLSGTTPTDHQLSPQSRPLQTEQPSEKDGHRNLSSMPLRRSGPYTTLFPAILLTLPSSKAVDKAHLCIPQNQALGVCRRPVPDIQVRGSQGREDLVNAVITSNTEEEEEVCLFVGCLTSQQHASVSQGRICSDNCTCCQTEIEAADQTFYLTQSQHTATGPTSPSTDPIMPGAWQGSHWSANF